VSDPESELVPLAALAVLAEATPDEEPVDLPIAYIPRTPGAPTYREMIERAVGWGRR